MHRYYVPFTSGVISYRFLFIFLFMYTADVFNQCSLIIFNLMIK